MQTGLPSSELTILVEIFLGRSTPDKNLAEFTQLALSAGATVVATITGSRDKPCANFFVGTGKAEEIRQCVLATKADLVIFNHLLSPGQERNLERLFKCRVLDRTSLILDIFAKRARSFEGQLQVELAQLKHFATRLVRGWTHLERQRGGIGLRGPGETQLETDRRLIRKRIQVVEKRLEKLVVQRQQARKSRSQALIPTIVLVGYTNAGKSSLFNRLVDEKVYAEDKLFATLDTTFRRLKMPGLGTVIFADTVGFIQDLPHDLITSFHATLQETQEAALLLHVIDTADESSQFNIEQVEKVLHEIHSDKVPRIEVYNKIDLLQGAEPHLEWDKEHDRMKVWISTQTGAGINLLFEAISRVLSKEVVKEELKLTPEQSRLRAKLYELDAVVTEKVDEAGNSDLSICMKKLDYQKLFKKI